MYEYIGLSEDLYVGAPIKMLTQLEISKQHKHW